MTRTDAIEHTDAPSADLKPARAALAVAEWFLAWQQDEDDEGISNLKMQKLLYFAQGHFLAKHNVPLFKEEIEAWARGPVIRNVYNTFKKHGRAPIDEQQHLTKFNWDSHRDVEQDLIEIWNRYGCYTSTALGNFTHLQGPWRAAFDETAGSAITHDSLRRYFAERP